MHEYRYDTRKAERIRRSDAIFWSEARDGPLEMAWLLEASDQGLAFAWRGVLRPREGRAIWLRLEASRPNDRVVPATVRRVSRAHDDLFVIACQMRPGDKQAEGLLHAVRTRQVRVAEHDGVARDAASSGVDGLDGQGSGASLRRSA